MCRFIRINQYQSFDLDFVTHSNLKELEKAFTDTEFFREGRFFRHPDTDFFVDFPSPPISVGNSPVTEFNTIRDRGRAVKLLSPTHCVMDRLAAYFHWNDMQSLDQAVLVASCQPINMEVVKRWARSEGSKRKFERFLSRLSDHADGQER